MALPVITNNSPSAGSISWTAFGIQFDGVSYSVAAGNSAQKYVWWAYNGGTPTIQASNAMPTLTQDDFLLFLNKSGIGVLVDATQVIDGSLIVSQSILADGIGANQITTEKIAANAVTAAEIAANAVTANSIAAGAITAEKLSIGAVGDNMVLNGSFEDGVQGFEIVSSGAGAVADVVTGVSSSGANALRLVRGTAANLVVGQDAPHYIPVTSVASRKWYVACRAGAGSALASGFYLRVYWFQADRVTAASTTSVDVAANVALTTAWSVFEGSVTPPANARYMRIAVINALSGSTMYVDEITAHEVVMSAQIGDGQIIAAKVAANAITANAIAANAITAAKIAATAIDGKTITGATVRTAASGQRVQLDTTGLRTFDASNAETSKLEASAGGLNLTGSLVSRAGVTGPRTTLDSGYIYIDNQDTAGSVLLTDVAISRLGAGVPFAVGHDSNGADSPLQLYASGDNEIQMTGKVVANGKPVPYAVAAGRSSITATPYTTVTFPVGRFTQVPRVTASVVSAAGGVVSFPWFGNSGVHSTSSFSIAILTLGAAWVAGTVEWHAIQMSSADSSG